ncbi:MAG: hypothetical protein ABIR83_04635 [Nakamurella sp.]
MPTRLRSGRFQALPAASTVVENIASQINFADAHVEPQRLFRGVAR